MSIMDHLLNGCSRISRYTMNAQRTVLIFTVAGFLAGCVATPDLHVKNADMTAAINQKIPTVTRAAVSSDGKYILSGSIDSTFRLWDIAAGRELRKHTVTPESSNMGFGVQVAFSPDAKHAVSAGAEHLTVWDIVSGTEVRSYEIDNGFPSDLSISSDGKQALLAKTGVFSGNLSLLELETGKATTMQRSGGHTQCFSGALSPSGKYALSGDAKKMILWDALTGKAIQEVQASDSDFFGMPIIHATVFSPDEKYALSGGYDNTLRLWTIPALSEVKRLKGHGGGSASALQYLGVMSAAFSPDGKYAVSGGGDNIIKLWDLSTGAAVRAFTGHSGNEGVTSVKFTPDGKRIVSAGDASIRIWDVSTGEEIATLIGFADGEWLVTTPNGYYNASEKGDQYLSVMIGGHPYSIGQLRESFYRPDLVTVALSGGSLKEFRKMADIKQPPAVAIIDTPGSVAGQEATITLKISDTGGGIGDIRLYLNGTAVVLDSSRGVAVVPAKSAGDVVNKYNIKLSSGANTIRAIAFNGDNSMQSTDALHTINASFKTAAKPSLYALVIGINEYKNPKLQLNYAVADAKLFADTLSKAAAPLFQNVVVKRLLTPAETAQENILKELKSFRSLNPDDLFVFYVASHGTVDDGEYFLITSNVGSTSTTKLKADAISQNTLKEIVANIPATKKLIVIDTCSAGKLGDAIQTAMLTRGMSEDTAMKVLSRAVGSTILSASTSVQEALEGYKGHGLFTYVLAEGLNGKADKGKSGFVRTTELADYVDNEVPALAEKVFKRAQYPTISISGMGFPIGQMK